MIYLDNAATTNKKPELVYEEVINILKNYGVNPGRGGYKLSTDLSMKIYNTRVELGKFMNFHSYDRVIFTKNATESLNIGIKGVLSENDHVIISDLEHNSVIRPLKKLEMEKNVKISVVHNKNGYISLEDIKSKINEKTKLVVLTHVSNVLGTIQDIEKVGKYLDTKGILFLVDAAQSAGVVEIDMERMKIDILCLTGHKHLLAPQGVGALLIKDTVEIDTLIEGGTGSFSDELQPDIFPDKLESGTLNAPAISAMGKSVKFINEVGLENIRKKDEELISYFIENIKDLEGVKIYNYDINKTSSVVSINIKDYQSSDIEDYLSNEYNIITRSGLHCAPMVHKSMNTLKTGMVRFSFSYFNTKDEIDLVVKAIKEILEK